MKSNLKRPNLLKSINTAFEVGGLSCKLADEIVDVMYNWTPFVHHSEHCNGDYQEEIKRIPGVECDSGAQFDGYCFTIDLKRFTPASERRLKKTVEKHSHC